MSGIAVRAHVFIALCCLVAHEGRAKPPSEAAASTDSSFRFRPVGFIRLRLAHDEEDGSEATRFSLPQVRLGAKVRYERLLWTELTVAADDFEFRLLEAWFNVRAHGEHLQVQAGYFKLPFTRERLTPVAHVGGVNRTLIRRRFNQGRDLGLMLHNGLTDHAGFEWAVGVFADFSPEDIDPEQGLANLRPTLAARVGWHTKKAKGYRETDRFGGPLRGGVGAGVMVYFEEGRDTPGARGLRWTADGILKAYGWTLTSAVFGRTATLDDPTHDLGVHAHLGHRFVQLPVLELVARYGGFFPDATDARHEVTGGLNVYLFEEHFRIRADASFLRRPELGRAEPDGWRVRLQLAARY